jgi:class 3 adenylate cyclase
MRYHQFHYRWEWQLRSSPEQLWPFVADTNRFNYETGVPAVERSAIDGAATSATRRLRFVRLGVTIEWDEEPFEWVRPYCFGVVRHYRRGPVELMRVRVELTPRPDGGTHMVYQVWATPKNPLGLAAIPAQIGVLSRRSFDRAIRRYDAVAAGGMTPLDLPPVEVEFAPGGRRRLAALRDQLIADGGPAELVDRLVETIETKDDLMLSRLRPYALADHWGAGRRQVLELCLLATRAGLLEFRWELICPHCRGAADVHETLATVDKDTHCDSCHVDFTVNFDRMVELTFRPSPAIRPVESVQFCVGGPEVTPHVVAQQILPPGAERRLTLPLEPGRYLLRSPAVPVDQPVEVAGDGAAEASVQVSADGWGEQELRIAPVSTLRLTNAGDQERLILMERVAWSDQAATAAEVTALQAFRDLFSREALRPGEQISVGTLTILFTDLRGSTRMYREVGDATAFGQVMDHFDVLKTAIADEEGALVKTIGDAVMAVFRRPVAAVRAIHRAQEALANPPTGMKPLVLKAGIHNGACIAVTLNERLDYFGSTVNIAARLEGQSQGGDIVISDVVRADPEVAELLADAASGLTAEPFEATLKGLESEHFRLWRVRAAPSPDPSPAARERGEVLGAVRMP